MLILLFARKDKKYFRNMQGFGKVITTFPLISTL